MLGLVLLLVGSVAADKHVHDRPVESDGSGHVHCELAMSGQDAEEDLRWPTGAPGRTIRGPERQEHLQSTWRTPDEPVEVDGSRECNQLTVNEKPFDGRWDILAGLRERGCCGAPMQEGLQCTAAAELKSARSPLDAANSPPPAQWRSDAGMPQWPPTKSVQESRLTSGPPLLTAPALCPLPLLPLAPGSRRTAAPQSAEPPPPPSAPTSLLSTIATTMMLWPPLVPTTDYFPPRFPQTALPSFAAAARAAEPLAPLAAAARAAEPPAPPRPWTARPR